MSSQTNPIEVTRPLAEFVHAWRWENIPASVRHEAKRSLMNFFAVALGGCSDSTIAKAASVLRRAGSGTAAGTANTSGPATIIGRGEHSNILDAAMLNAMCANVFDFDDTHIPTVIHPTAPVAPVLLALAQSMPASAPLGGAQLLLAFILGVEVECRIGNAVSPGHYQRGWHITSSCGVFGAAAAAGRVLGLTPQQLAWSFGSAANQACGLVETLGTMAKSTSVGNAARNGLLSALLAQDNFTGPDAPLEGKYGFLNVTCDQPDLTGLVAELGERWEIMANTYKPYPCGVVLNPVIDACLELRAALLADGVLDGAPDVALDATQIERINVTGHPLLRRRTDRPGVRSGRESQVSAQHAAAITLLTGRAGLDEFSDAAVARADVQALGAKLHMTDDDSISMDGVRISISLAGGQTRSATIAHARGSLGNPLSDRDLEDKLKELCRYGQSGCDAERLIEAVWSLDRAADAGTLVTLAAGTKR